MAIDMKEIIAEKFSEISKTKSIDKITVKELVEACNISRQAFYYHFQDIMDVASWLSKKRIHGVLQASAQAESIEDAIRVFVTFFSESREVIMRRLESSMYRQYEALLNDEIRAFLKDLAQRGNKSVSYTDFEAAMEFCVGGIYTMLMTYTGKSAEMDQWLTRQLKRLVSGELSLV